MLLRGILPATSLLLLCAAAALVSAHGAAPPREPWKRVAADCNDDWGGHSVVNDGHDLIAMDVTERYAQEVEDDVVVVRLVMNGGFASSNDRPVLKETLTLVSPTRTVRPSIETTDNQRFTSSGTPAAVYVRGPPPAPNAQGNPDGSRFIVEAAYRYVDLGIQPGQKLSGFSAQGWAGERRADFMPGGYSQYTPTGETRVTQCPLNGTQSEVYYPSGEYAVSGSASVYFQVVADTARVVANLTSNNTRIVQVGNKLANTEQTLYVNATAPAAWSVHVTNARMRLAGGAKEDAQIHLTPAEGAVDGNVIVTLQSPFGGYQAISIPVRFGAEEASVSATPGTDPTTPSKGMPGFEALVALAALAWVGRRRT